jgi:hypothetical protein
MKRMPEYRDGSVDAGLLMLLALTPRGMTRTHEEIAFVCGCSKGYIWHVEKRARLKMRKEFERLRREGKL